MSLIDRPPSDAPPAMSSPSESPGMHEASRREKLRKIQELGFDPWGSRFDGQMPIGEIRSREGEITVEPIPPRWRKELDEETLDPWGHSYQYRNPGRHNPDKYDVFSMGPDGLPDTDDDIGNWPDPKASKTP